MVSMGDLILAIDQGTTGTTALLVDATCAVRAACTVEVPNHFPEPGRVEHDAEEIWASVAAAVTGVLQGVDPRRLVAIGLTNQRETTVLWDAKTGRAVHRALVWQDRRTAGRCDELRRAGFEPQITLRTGLVLDPYFSATKAEWLLDHVPGAHDAARTGALRLGTVESWLVFRMSGGAHVSDVSNASRTLLFDIERLIWDEELCALFRVPLAALPEVVDNAGVVATTKGVGFLPDDLPIAGLAGDQQAALFGQACFSPGMAKATYGTGAFVLLLSGEKVPRSHHGLLSTVAWRLGGRVSYAVEGSAFIAGAAVQWLRDGLGLIASSAEVEALAASVPDTGGVVFVPALTGLGAPHWRPEARGLVTGLTRGTTRGHVARAVLDGIAHEVADILDAMARDAGRALVELRVDGGAARNDLLMQRQCDLLGVPCVRPKHLETTALGAAFLAGIGIGVWSSLDELTRSWALERTFRPGAAPAEVAESRRLWAEAVRRA